MGGTTVRVDDPKSELVQDRKSIVHKILKTLHFYTEEENLPKTNAECILLTGGGILLGNLAATLC